MKQYKLSRPIGLIVLAAAVYFFVIPFFNGIMMSSHVEYLYEEDQKKRVESRKQKALLEEEWHAKRQHDFKIHQGMMKQREFEPEELIPEITQSQMDKGLVQCAINNTGEEVQLQSVRDSVQVLDCVAKSIKDLMGINRYANLRTLNLASNDIEFIVDLLELNYLDELDLSHNPIQDGYQLENMPSLVDLKLSGINTMSAGQLKGLLNLNYLEYLAMPNTQNMPCDELSLFLQKARFEIDQGKQLTNYDCR